MRLRTDPKLREVLHGLYLALFQAKKDCPSDFRMTRLTKIQTEIMGIEGGWRVIGITPEALDLLATQNFRKDKLPLCRGHRVDRIQTAKEVFERDQPLGIEEFFELFLKNDDTVIMLKKQNKHAESFPEFIPIDNPTGELFPGAFVGWMHREKERDLLRALYSARGAAQQSAPADAASPPRS